MEEEVKKKFEELEKRIATLEEIPKQPEKVESKEEVEGAEAPSSL